MQNSLRLIISAEIDVGDGVFKIGLETQCVRFVHGSVAVRDATVDVFVFLHEISRRVFHHGGDCLHVFVGVELFDQSRAELVIYSALVEKVYACLYLGYIHPVKSHGERIFLGTVFHVHSHVVHKPFCKDLFHDVGAKSVGVELCFVTHISHLLQKLGKIGLKSRFSARNAHGVHEPFALLKIVKHSFKSPMTRGALWQNGQRKLHPPVKTVQAMLPS